VLRQDVARDPHFIERFKREARAASRLDHPNSVRVFDFGSSTTRCFTWPWSTSRGGRCTT
jgi:serine/threonine protein kinase